VSFAKEGCRKIVLADRNVAGLHDTACLINEAAGNEADHLCVSADVLRPEQIDNVLEKAVSRFGRVDYAVNAAGMVSHGMADGTLC
jgi:NAD(P)-dependent dehydrogenase (short-subunit alcohol dehydrogenase family)